MPHRYFIDTPLLEGARITLPKEELKHIKNVMRTKPGEAIEIINGHGQLATAPYGTEIVIESVQSHDIQTQNGLALALSEPKHLELVIEKGTELGITDFTIFPSQKSKLKELSLSKKERLTKILISALKQSKRLHLPKIHYLPSKEHLPQDANYLIADFAGETYKPSKESHTFIIGPESGFTPQEIAFFKDHLSAKPILLSNSVLRTETAAICAAVLLSL